MLRRRPILISRIGLAAVFGCAVLGAACGQTGPLYRSDEKAPQATPQTSSPANNPASNPASNPPGNPANSPSNDPADDPAENPAGNPSDSTDNQPSGKKKSAPVFPAPQSQKEDRVRENPAPADTPASPVDPDRPSTVPPGQPSGER